MCKIIEFINGNRRTSIKLLTKYSRNRPENYYHSYLIFIQRFSYQVGILGNAAYFHENAGSDNAPENNLDRRQMMIAFDMRYCWRKELLFSIILLKLPVSLLDIFSLAVVDVWGS